MTCVSAPGGAVLVIDLDATIVIAHPEKEQARGRTRTPRDPRAPALAVPVPGGRCSTRRVTSHRLATSRIVHPGPLRLGTLATGPPLRLSLSLPIAMRDFAITAGVANRAFSAAAASLGIYGVLVLLLGAIAAS